MSGNGGSVRVIHREYITDLESSKDFSADVWPINPGNSDTFPWLHAVALQFEVFRLNKLRFEYVATSGDALNSTNAALGAIIMSTQYNATNPPFSSKFQMENYEGSVSVKPSKNAFHYVDCIRSRTPMNPMYVQSVEQQISSLNGQGNVLQYQLGQFYLASVGMQEAGYRCGELWVSYDITLIKPRLNPYLSLLAPIMDLYIASTGTQTEKLPLGNVSDPIQAGYNPINTMGTVFHANTGARSYWTMPNADPVGTLYRVTVWTGLSTTAGFTDPQGWVQVNGIGFASPADGVDGNPTGYFYAPAINTGGTTKQTTLIYEAWLQRTALAGKTCQFSLIGPNWNLSLSTLRDTHVCITYFYPGTIFRGIGDGGWVPYAPG